MKSKSDKLGVKGLSKAFGVSQVSIRNWIDKGIPCKQTSKGYIFDLTEAIQWREKHLQESKQGNDEYEAARTEKEVYRAKMAKLNYERIDGTLVPSKDVRAAAFEKARLLRDQLLNIPNRIAPILAAEKDPKRVNEILTQEIRLALETLSGGTQDADHKNTESGA